MTQPDMTEALAKMRDVVGRRAKLEVVDGQVRVTMTHLQAQERFKELFGPGARMDRVTREDKPHLRAAASQGASPVLHEISVLEVKEGEAEDWAALLLSTLDMLPTWRSR